MRADVLAGLMIGAFLGAAWLMPAMAQTVGPGLNKPLDGIGRAADGDTIMVGRKLIQLDGINAPELKQKCFNRKNKRYQCGQNALKLMQKMVDNQQVSCRIRTENSFGLIIGDCFANGRNVAEQMVRRGMAVARGLKGRDYLPLEQKARQGQKGMWQGQFANSKVWRHGYTIQDGYNGVVNFGGTFGGAGKCVIKGNKQPGGNVYYMPWDDWYHRAQVRTNRGDRWFCSEKEAKKAGFKRRPTISVYQGGAQRPSTLYKK